MSDQLSCTGPVPTAEVVFRAGAAFSVFFEQFVLFCCVELQQKEVAKWIEVRKCMMCLSVLAFLGVGLVVGLDELFQIAHL